MNNKTAYRALAFIAKYQGDRRKAFMGYCYDFSEHKLPLKRAPFTTGTISRLIFDGLVTSTGRVKLTDRGYAELCRLYDLPSIKALELPF